MNSNKRVIAKVVTLAAFAWIACGDDGAGLADGSLVDANVDAAAEIVASPAAPVEITFACPTGFRQVAHASGASICDPWPDTGRATCTGAEIHVPGTPGCESVGARCPAGDYAEDLPSTGQIWHVLAGAPDGGDGSMGAPFDAIADGIGRASAGDTILVGKGRYDEVVRLTKRVSLRGACAAETIVTVSASTLPTDAALLVGASGVEVRDLTVADPVVPGVRVVALGDASFEGVVIRGATGAGILGESGGRLVARRIAIRDQRAFADGTAGRGINVQDGAEVEVSEGEIDGALDVGVFVRDSRARAVLDRVSVHGTRSQESDRRWGFGLGAQDGGAIEATASAIEDNREVAVSANDGGALVRLTDCVVRATAPRESDEEGGRGVNAVADARVELSRVSIEDSHDVGLVATQGAVVTVADVVISGVRAAPGAPSLGRGVDLQLGASLTGERLLVHDVLDGGMLAFDVGTQIALSDVVIRDVAPNAAMAFGRGLSVELGADVRLTRARIERVYELGLFAASATIAFDDVVIADVESEMSGGTTGRALVAQEGAVVQLRRTRFERVREVGLTAHHAGTRVDGEDVSVLDVRRRACAETTCSDDPGGSGIGATGGAAIELRRFEIDGAPLCGVHLGPRGEIDLHDGAIHGCGVGACIQEMGYDTSRLEDDVEYRDNGVNLDTVSLPVPGASMSQVAP